MTSLARHALVFGGAAITAAACSVFGPAERAHVANTANALEQCQEKGREGPDGGHLAAYEACMREAGLHE